MKRNPTSEEAKFIEVVSNILPDNYHIDTVTTLFSPITFTEFVSLILWEYINTTHVDVSHLEEILKKQNIEIRRKGLASDRKNNKSVAVYHINYISSDKISPIWNELNDLKP